MITIQPNRELIRLTVASFLPKRFCDVEFHGPLSIQEEWVRHLQRHILDVNFPKVEAVREEISTSAEPEK